METREDCLIKLDSAEQAISDMSGRVKADEDCLVEPFKTGTSIHE